MKTLIYCLAISLISLTACKKNMSESYPKDGLVSYFNFDDNLLDQQGYAQSGTAKMTYITGKKGKAVQFDGVDQLVEFNAVNPQNQSKISLACWVKTNENGALKYFLNSNSFAAATASGKINFIIINPVTNAVTSNTLISGEWTHVVGTYDGTNIKIYINGQWVATQNHPGSINGFTSQLTLGFYNGMYWAGALDEIFLYNRVLTDTEIQAIYQLK